MKKAQANKAASGNGAITLPFHVVRCWRDVPDAAMFDVKKVRYERIL